MKKTTTAKNTGIPYEIVVQSIFQEILAQDKANNIQVQHNISLQGKLSKHQIDVLWAFSVGGISYTTVVQVRDWASKIKQGHVNEFHDILEDLPGQPRGVIVTKSGFQAGARNLATKHGIKLYLLRDHAPRLQLPWLGYGLLQIDLQNRVFRLNAFSPEFAITFLADPTTVGKIPKLPATHDARCTELLGSDGVKIGVVSDILQSYISDMKADGRHIADFDHAFTLNTFIKPSVRANRLVQLRGMKTKVKLVPMPEQTVPLLESGIVCFILEDLESSRQRLFQRKHKP